MKSRIVLGLSCVMLMMAIVSPAAAVITAGNNLDGPLVGPIPVPWNDNGDHFVVDEDLYFDPDAGPMIKLFETQTIEPILPGTVLPVWENWHLTRDPQSRPVDDWHEEILTPGWEWVIPGQTFVNAAGQTQVWDPNGSLITLNGQPHPWWHIPHPGHPAGHHDPTKLWVAFPPIFPGQTLDVHKGLLWNGGTIWEGGVIEVLEYPTPEPASLALLGLGGLMMLKRRRVA